MLYCIYFLSNKSSNASLEIVGQLHILNKNLKEIPERQNDNYMFFISRWATTLKIESWKVANIQ